jgi:AcrR family transcriptional regulator
MPEAAETNSTEAAPLASVPTAIGTRQTILATAQRLFGERGYDATSLRQIADAVGMTKAAVYYTTRPRSTCCWS